MTVETWEPTPGQCLCCAGRGGWWSGEIRIICKRCLGLGWDPHRHESWFVETVAPLQDPGESA